MGSLSLDVIPDQDVVLAKDLLKCPDEVARQVVGYMVAYCAAIPTEIHIDWLRTILAQFPVKLGKRLKRQRFLKLLVDTEYLRVHTRHWKQAGKKGRATCYALGAKGKKLLPVRKTTNPPPTAGLPEHLRELVSAQPGVAGE